MTEKIKKSETKLNTLLINMLLNIRGKEKGISALEKKSARRHFHAIWTLIEYFS
jgi:hypothetical protein